MRLGIAGLAAGVALVVFWGIDPIRFRLTVFQPTRELRLFVRELGLPAHWSTLRSTTLREPQVIVIRPEDDSQVKIVADVCEPDGDGPAPAMVLLHGSAPWGRRAGLIRLLAERLCDDGWIALAPDARGFGETGDPSDVDDPEAWNVDQDIGRIIDDLMQMPRVDPKRIFLFGHSLGANYALEGGLDDERIQALILVGPGRDLTAADAVHTRWQRARFSADRRLRVLIPDEVMRARRRVSDIALLADGRLAVDHKPILLVDGQRESAEVREFLFAVVERIHPPIQYVTLEGAGHYCGVMNLFGGSTVYYEPEVFERLVRLIVEYTRAVALSAGRPFSRSQPAALPK